MSEDYRAFLDRVHREDVAVGRAMHHPGVCAICDEARAATPEQGPEASALSEGSQHDGSGN